MATIISPWFSLLGLLFQMLYFCCLGQFEANPRNLVGVYILLESSLRRFGTFFNMECMVAGAGLGSGYGDPMMGKEFRLCGLL